MHLSIKAKPNARQNQIKLSGGVITVSVKAPPEDGKANKELLNYLSELFNIPKSKLSITSGAGTRFKKVFIPDEYERDVTSKVARLAADDTDGHG